MVSNGLEAVHEAQRLQPDLILLDIGLPALNGIEAARRIRVLSPNSKIIFVTQESSVDIVQEALSIGAHGYVVKTDAGSELLAAVAAVLQGGQFVGSRFSGNAFTKASGAIDSESVQGNAVAGLTERNTRIVRRHDVGFYSNDRGLLDDLTRFIGAALKAGDSAMLPQPRPTGTAFFEDCKPMAWILVLRFSNRDISRWTLATRSRLSCLMACPMRLGLRVHSEVSLSQWQRLRSEEILASRFSENACISCGQTAMLRRLFRWRSSVTDSPKDMT